MVDSEFVEFCYKKILCRDADQGGRLHYLDALNTGRLSREEMLLEFLNSDEFSARGVSREFVPAGHFYSAVPSVQDREVFLAAAKSQVETLGINVNQDYQFGLLAGFKNYCDECPFPENKVPGFRFYFENPSYSYTDALTLYCMMRLFMPSKVIEIGSGYSSACMLDTNDLFCGGNIGFTFIEPYPDLLYSLMKENDRKHLVIPESLQKVDLSIFESLGENDILFIDSTHVSKLNSDVNRIFFEILPRLNEGVIIHFHDIFWPFEYPKEWVKEGRAWNEAYMLRSFLEFNSAFEVLFFSNYLHTYKGAWIKENLPILLKNAGGNIWLRRIAKS